MNKVILIGHLGGDCELKYTQGGNAVANMRVAVTEKWTNKDGEKQERTEWVSLVWWGKGAEAVKPYLVKGKQIAVEGKLQTDEWEDKEGNKRYSTKVRVDSIQLLGGGERNDNQQRGNQGRGQQQNRGGGQQQRGNQGWSRQQRDNAPATDNPYNSDDDIPF